MEKTNILTLIITLVVGIILAGSLLMPVLNDVTATQKTFTNKGYYDMTYTDEDDITLFWDHTKPAEVTVNGEAVPLSAPEVGLARTVICGDDWLVRYSKAGNGTIGIEYNANGSSVGANVSNGRDLTVTATGGTVTITNGSNTATDTYTYLYSVVNDGEFVMKESGENAYINADSTIYAMGVTFGILTNVNVYLKTTGTLGDGLTSTAFIVSGTNDPLTVETPVMNYTEVDGYKDLYSLSSFTVDVTDGVNTGTATYTYFIVPAEVTAELSEHLTPGQISLMGAIPVMVIVALLMAAVGAIALRRAD